MLDIFALFLYNNYKTVKKHTTRKSMNLVTVTGGKKSQRESVESMAHYVINKLMPRMRTLDIEIEIKDFGYDTSCGYCLPAGHASGTSPRDFEIEINKDLELRTMLETIAHEMVHVKQYARNELKQLDADTHRWMGDTVSDDDVEYWDLPWEVEAHGRETGLFVRWAEDNGYTGKWTKSRR